MNMSESGVHQKSKEATFNENAQWGGPQVFCLGIIMYNCT